MSFRAHLVRGENILISLILALLVFLPLAEIILRAAFDEGIEGVTPIIQHLTLAIASFGAAIAAREQRLLSFSSAQLLKGTAARYARIFSSAFAAAVTAVLLLASIEFIRLELESEKLISYSMPTWVLELVQPIGFALITFYLIYHASTTLTGRVAAVILAMALCSTLLTPVDPDSMVVVGLITLVFATLLGAPVFTAIAGAALIMLWSEDVPLASLAVDHYSMVTNPSLPTIPMFTLAGYFLAESRSPHRLVKVFHALFGQFRGGAAIIAVLACTFFTSFTGASGVTILALGGLIMPLLLQSGYGEKQALGLITAGGSPGVMLMPALPLILYAIVAEISIETMFLGGVLPALVFIVMISVFGARQQRDYKSEKFDTAKAIAAIKEARWELLLPVVPVGGLFSGLATPVETAALTALYAIVLTTLIHRDLKVSTDLPRVMAECGLLVGGILLILGVALALTNYMIDAQLPDRIIEWVTVHIESKWTFLLALNLFLLVVGCFMDIFSAIVVLVPLIVPIGQAFGINPIHLGMVFLANLELGYLTPPVGMNLFFSSYRFDKPVVEVYRSILPIFLLLCAGVLLITFVPALTTLLPELFQ